MKTITAIIAVCIFLLFSACQAPDEGIIEIRTSDSFEEKDQTASESLPVKIAVYVCGEVKAPGVYFFEEGSRIADAVKAAGGPRANADLRSVNLAQRLSDGQQIVVNPVPAEGEDISVNTGPSGGKVNLNRASAEELMMLPGIGEAKAGAIIRYREEVGWISSPDEIMNISGIKDRIYERIADLIEV